MNLQKKIIRKKIELFPYLAVLPVIILILIFKVYPVLSNIWDSFLYKRELSLVNYERILGDARFWDSLLITFKFNIILIPIQMVLAFFLALLVSLNIRGVGVFRTIYYLPVTISTTVACIMWSMMMNPNNGVINSILMKIGIAAQPFLTSKEQALGCIMLFCVWKGCPWLMMFLLTGLKDIDSALYESAKIDGASYWQSVLHITLPCLKRTLTFVLINATTSNLLLFAPMYQLTQGGPRGSTNVLMYEIYKSGFIYGDQSRCSALMTVLLFFVGLIVIFQYKAMSRED